MKVFATLTVFLSEATGLHTTSFSFVGPDEVIREMAGCIAEYGSSESRAREPIQQSAIAEYNRI